MTDSKDKEKQDEEKQNDKQSDGDHESSTSESSAAGALGTAASTGESGSAVPVLIVVALLAGVAALLIWNKQNSVAEHVLTDTIEKLKGDDLGAVRTQLTKLEGLPEYELHRKTLTGAVLVREQNYTQADPLLEYLPEHQEIRALGLYYRGVANFKRKRFDEAASDFKASLKENPESEDTKQWLARAEQEVAPFSQVGHAIDAIKRNELDVARDIQQKLNDRSDTKPYATLVNGLVQLEERDFRDAVESFTSSGQSGIPELIEPSLLGLGRAHDGLLNHQVAFEWYRRALDNNPNCLDAHKWFALWYYELEALDAMSGHLQRAIELDPEDPRLRRMLATAYYRSKMFKEAIPIYENTIHLEMSDNLRMEIYMEWGESLTYENRFDDALKILNLPELDELKSMQLIFKRDALRAKCHASNGENEKAFFYLDRILAHDPTNLDALAQKGELLVSIGDLPGAIEAYQKAVDAHPYDLTIHLKLAQQYRRSKQDDLAAKVQARHDMLLELVRSMTEMENVADNDPDNTEIRIKLGRTAYQLGEVDLSKVWLNAVLRIDPTNQEAIRLLEALNTGKSIDPVEKEKKDDSDKAEVEEKDDQPDEKSNESNESKSEESNEKVAETENKDSDDGTNKNDAEKE